MYVLYMPTPGASTCTAPLVPTSLLKLARPPEDEYAPTEITFASEALNRAMRNLQGLSFDDIAQRMDRNSGAVRMLWLRAMEKLKQTATPFD